MMVVVGRAPTSLLLTFVPCFIVKCFDGCTKE